MNHKDKNLSLYFTLNLYAVHNKMYTYQNLTTKEATEHIIEAVPFKDKPIKVMWSNMEDIKYMASYVYNYEDSVDIVVNAKLPSELQHQTIIASLPFAAHCINAEVKYNKPHSHSIITIEDLYAGEYTDIIADTLCPTSVCYEALDFYELDKPKSDEKAFVMAQFLAEKLNTYPNLIEYQLKRMSDYE